MMRRIALALLLSLALALSAGSALAVCPTPWTGPYFAGVWTWYNYTPEVGCWTPSGDVSPSAMSCAFDTGFVFGMGWSNTISYTFVADPNATLPNWSADAFVEIVDPNHSWWNQVQITATVVHQGTATGYTLYYWNGTMGDPNPCMRQGGGFSAAGGDTITIQISVTKWYSDTSIKVSGANIFSTYP